ncbi:MAG TPA: hypothetical protein VG454_11500 [Gemmatimonadales bacterium]|nr:hypothetical protein [Gemmatimonadales bacterium]
MFVRRFFPVITLVLAIGCITVTPLWSQSAVALDFGITTLGDEYESYKLLEAGLRFGSLRPKQVNADVRITTFPDALTAGAVLLSADVDATYVLPLRKGIDLTPRAGMSLLGGASGDGADAATGVNFGVGVVAGLTSPIGIRFDFGHRTYLGHGAGVGASSFSMGIVWVH